MNPQMCLFSILGDRDLAKLSFECCKIPSPLAHFTQVVAIWSGISMIGRAQLISYIQFIITNYGFCSLEIEKGSGDDEGGS